MNSTNSSLLRIERALDRVERTLKMIDTRVGQLHAAANFSKKNNNTKTNNTKKSGSYFAKRPELFGRPVNTRSIVGRRKTNHNFAKLVMKH